MSTHSSPPLSRSAGAPANCFAATATRPAIVVAPLRDGVLAVPASIRFLQRLRVLGGFYVALGRERGREPREPPHTRRANRFLLSTPLRRPPPGRAPLPRNLRLRELRLAALHFLQRALEERLVDPTLKDRHPEFHALRDDFAPVHSGLTAQLGGRQVDRHGVCPPSSGNDLP